MAAALETLPLSLPSMDQVAAKIDLLISLVLHEWPALSLAVQNGWGGTVQESKEKREWFAGAISELLASNQVSHLDDLEEVLLQVMLDEFEVVVDDDSGVDVATRIWNGREKILKGEFEDLNAMYGRWQEKQRKYGTDGQRVAIQQVEEDEDGQDTDWDDDDDDESGRVEDDSGHDEQMQDAPPLAETNPAKEKYVPEVDEEGFTKVVGRKKR